MKKIIPNILIISLFLVIVGMFIYDYVYLKKPLENNIIRIIMVVAGLIITLVRINGQEQKRPLWFYEKAYKDKLGEAFVRKPALRKKLLSAVRFFDEEKYYKALEELDKLLKKCDDDADFSAVLLFRAICFERTGLKDEAEKLYKEVLDFNPYSVTAYNNLAMIYDSYGDTEMAISYYRKAIDIDKEYAAGYSNISYCYFNMEDYESAKEYAKKALSIREDFYQASTNLAIIYALEGDEENKKKYFNLAVKHGQNAKSLDQTIEYYLYLKNGQDETEED